MPGKSPGEMPRYLLLVGKPTRDQLPWALQYLLSLTRYVGRLPFDPLLAFFNDEDRQRRMEDAELHHDRPPLAGVVRELESQPEVDKFLASLKGGKPTRSRR